MPSLPEVYNAGSCKELIIFSKKFGICESKTKNSPATYSFSIFISKSKSSLGCMPSPLANSKIVDN